MCKYFKQHLWGIYLGAALGFIGYGVTSTEFWIVFVPTAVLNIWKEW